MIDPTVAREAASRQSTFEAPGLPAKKAKRPRPSVSELLGREFEQCGVYRRLIWDDRISAGAFRYWHYLRDQMDAHSYVREYYASMRTIEAALHCKHESVTGWNEQLSAAGYLSWERQGTEHKHRYRVLNGFGQPMKGENTGQWELPMVYGMERRRVPPTAHTTGADGVHHRAHTIGPSGADGVPPMVHAPYIQGNEVRGNGGSPRELWQISKDIERLLDIKKRIGGEPPSEEKAEKLKKVKWAMRLLDNEALEHIAPGLPAPLQTAAAPKRVTVDHMPADQPGPMFGTPEYEKLKKAL